MTTAPPVTDDPRSHLVAALRAAGPDAATLCEGWRTRHLAAHVWLREREPWRLAAGALDPRASVESVIQEVGDAAADVADYALLVARFESEPPPWHPFVLLPAANALEYAVHAEDVRRGEGPAAEPVHHASPVEAQIWQAVRLMARGAYRRCGVGVVLVVTDGPRSVVARGEQSVVVTGTVTELALHATGRRSAALVTVTGPPEAVETFAAWAGPQPEVDETQDANSDE